MQNTNPPAMAYIHAVVVLIGIALAILTCLFYAISALWWLKTGEPVRFADTLQIGLHKPAIMANR